MLIAHGQAIVRLDPLTGNARIVSAGGDSFRPLSVTLAANGSLFVLNRGAPNEILRVHPENGDRTVVSQGGYLNRPQAIVAADRFIFGTDVATPDGQFDMARVIRVDSQTGEQTIVSEGDSLVRPVGIALEADGQIVVGDPYTTNPESLDFYDGGIVRINPATGAQTLMARGYGGMVNPCGLRVVPEQPAARRGVAVNARHTN